MYKEQKTEQLIMKLAAQFLLHESNMTSLITVTGIELSEKMSKAAILITVLPEVKEQEALDFTRRKRSEFREYFKNHARIARIPIFDFEIDYGEKNRQKIEEISKAT